MSDTLTVRYSAVKGSGLRNKDAQIIGEEIRHLGDNATCYAIVARARPKRSPLHPYFEWDDAKAAQTYRLAQAEKLARSIVVKISQNGEQIPIRAFHAVHVQRSNGGPVNLKSYVTFESVLDDPERTEQVLEEARRGLQSWVQKYRIYKELLGPTVREVLEEMSGRA